MDETSKIKGIKVHRALQIHAQGPLFSLSYEKHDCSLIAEALYSTHAIEVRSGLHCAPLAHQTLDTYPSGTVRIAPSVYHSREDFEYLLDALENSCARMRLLILFHSTRDVIRAERMCRENAMKCKAIPVPRGISSECGIALEITAEEKKSIVEFLMSQGIDLKVQEY